MNILELREWVKRRLSRKARQAEKAYVSEFTIKRTTNCLNHGIQLGESTFHCKINALGLHEQGASQCWNNKAQVCPVFELLRDVETLKRDFRKMQPNELAIRWPSLGELIRFDHMLSLVEAEDHGNVEPPVYQSGNQLPLSGDETGIGPADGDVRREHRPGCSHSTLSNQAGIDASGTSDARSSEFGAGDPSSMSMATLHESRDRSGANREAV
jgi:hypothetical protein